jgi:hypothetical protein
VAILASMPGLERVPPNVRTTYLGEFTAEHAVRIARQLEEEDIVWWSKEPGYLSRIWEHGVRLFVDRAEVEHAREVARGVISGDL